MSKKDNVNGYTKNYINWYPGHMAKTKRLIKEKYDLIDVVYEIIDARMPKSSKIKDIDNFIKNKPRVMIMTKIDLCDMNETKKWVKYYEEKGYKVYLTEEPTDFIKESEILKIYMDTPGHDDDYRELCLLCASDRVQHSNGIISQKLKEGYIVISDRYIDIELQEKLHDLYLNIARENQGVVVSTILPEDICFERILFEVKKVVATSLRTKS